MIANAIIGAYLFGVASGLLLTVVAFMSGKIALAKKEQKLAKAHQVA